MHLVTVDPQDGPAQLPFAMLAGCRIVVTGFKPEEAAELLKAFQSAGASCRTVTPVFLGASVYSCDLLVAWLGSLEEYDTVLESYTGRLIAAVSPESLVGYLPWMRQSAVDFVYCPCTENEILARAAMALRRRQPHPDRNPHERFRILLADDDRATTALLKVAIDSDRMTCRCVDNGLDALETARAWAPDLAILDVRMPGLDGYQVLAALRREARRTPVLLLTGCDQESDIIKGFKLGAVEYVVKPFDPVEVLARVKRIVAETA
jgi:DNA-binding response OmpR family regulator